MVEPGIGQYDNKQTEATYFRQRQQLQYRENTKYIKQGNAIKQKSGHAKQQHST